MRAARSQNDVFRYLSINHVCLDKVTRMKCTKSHPYTGTLREQNGAKSPERARGDRVVARKKVHIVHKIKATGRIRMHHFGWFFLVFWRAWVYLDLANRASLLSKAVKCVFVRICIVIRYMSVVVLCVRHEI